MPELLADDLVKVNELFKRINTRLPTVIELHNGGTIRQAERERLAMQIKTFEEAIKEFKRKHGGHDFSKYIASK